jgi:hypothetical protein
MCPAGKRARGAPASPDASSIVAGRRRPWLSYKPRPARPVGGPAMSARENVAMAIVCVSLMLVIVAALLDWLT